MALIAAIGGRESNSFCVTIAEAQGYIDLLGMDTTGWKAQSQEQQEFCLQLAAQALEFFPWTGQRIYCGQALVFPRSSQGTGPYSYPTEIKQAQAQIAFNVIYRALQALANQPPEDGPPSDSRVTRVSLGGMLDVWFSSDPAKTGTILDRLTRSLQFPIYLALTKWISQFRGGIIKDLIEEPTCSTTTTTTSTTSTTTTTATAPQ